MNEVKSQPYDFAAYQSAKIKTDRERQRLNAAHAALDNASIRERLAEMKSQSEPLASLMYARVSERERLYAAAFYCVNGRMPNMESDSGGEGE